jgi:hypothetical protein
MQKVTLADDADQPIGGVDNGDPADAPFGKQLGHLLHRRVRVDGNHVHCHDIYCAHPITLVPFPVK